MERQALLFPALPLLTFSEILIVIIVNTATSTSTDDGRTFAAAFSVDMTSEPRPSDTVASGAQTPAEDDNFTMEAKSDQALPSALFTSPDSSMSCQPVEHTLTDSSGVLTMTDIPDDCMERRVWNIQLPSPEDGIVLQFVNVSMGNKGQLTILSFRHDTSTVVERWFYGGFYSHYEPLLLSDSRLRIVFDFQQNIILEHTVSFFNLTYNSHSLQKMPVPLAIFDTLTSSSRVYSCAEHVLVPSALRCNMVKECINNEDEEDCDYTRQGCGDWVPFRDSCYKVEFTRHLQPRNEERSLTIPNVAQEGCVTQYGARLAFFRDSDEMEFVGNLVRQAGFLTAIVGFKKVSPVSKSLKHLYRYLWQFGDQGSPIAYLQQDLQRIAYPKDCTKIAASVSTTIFSVQCDNSELGVDGYVCMKPNPFHHQVQADTLVSVHLSRPSRQVSRFPTRNCADGSLAQLFHRCPQEDRSDPETSSLRNFALFPCRYGPSIHYTLVCDGNADCLSGDDEENCGEVRFSSVLDSMFRCKNFQLVHKFQWCDGSYDCFDESDEKGCWYCPDQKLKLCSSEGCLPISYNMYITACPTFHPQLLKSVRFDSDTLVSLDGFGMSFLLPVGEGNTGGVFRCWGGRYSIPSFLLNNGERDCMSGEDENIPLENMTCPGFYRCWHSSSCVHPDYVCDNIHHCPYKDDERYCDIMCPDGCLCEGYAFSCTHISNISDILSARYLDLSGSANVSLSNVHLLQLLRFLNLSNCGLQAIHLRIMPQVQILDLSFNKLKNITSVVLENLPGLRYLNISCNPIVYVLDTSFGAFAKSSGLDHLRSLIMRDTDLHSITDRPFSPLSQLEILDIRNNFIDSYDREVFWGLDSLKLLYTDDSKLCCPYFYYSQTLNCIAPFDELSSCSDLLRLNVFRVFLWLVALLAILGNAGVVLYRVFLTKQKTFSAFRVLVGNLCTADLIMGIYMTMIGIADAQFQGMYVAKENAWKRSLICKMAGFLGFVSSETSALTICLITLDRVLVLCFPLRSHLHLTARSSVAVCAVVWLVAVIMASVPLLADLEFYGVSSICLPLPITRRQFSGQFYSFGVYIVFNFAIFAVIGIGQILIYHAILNASKTAGTRRKSQEMTIARRLFLVILSDFCCWFPIGIMGLLAEYGKPISDEVNVWTAIFVLPLNSAINPFLYTLNNVLEKWRARKLQKESKMILINIQTQLPRLLPSTAEEIVRICIQSSVVKREKILQMLHLGEDRGVGDG